MNKQEIRDYRNRVWFERDGAVDLFRAGCHPGKTLMIDANRETGEYLLTCTECFAQVRFIMLPSETRSHRY